MTLDAIRTASGKKYRTPPLLALPGAVSLTAAAEAPGSIILSGPSDNLPFIAAGVNTVGGMDWRQLALLSADGRELQIGRNSNDANGFGSFRLSRGRTGGSVGTALQNGDVLGDYNWWGRYSETDGAFAGRVRLQVDGAVTGSSLPVRLKISATPSGSVVLSDVVDITPAGNVLIGNTTGTERLDVTGNIKASGDLIGSTLITSGLSSRTPPLATAPNVLSTNPATVPGAIVLAFPTSNVPYIAAGTNNAGAIGWRNIVLRSEDTRDINLGIASDDPNFFGRFTLGKSRIPNAGAIDGTALVNGDIIGDYLWSGRFSDSGSAFAARVRALVDGVVSPTNLATRLRVSTVPNGSLVLSDIIDITPAGNVLIGNTTGTDRLSVTGNISATGNFRVGSNQVLAARRGGWTAPTGTSERTTYATYTAPTITNPPTQAEVQAIATHVQLLSRRLRALIEDGIAHGFIGA
jgi:hypothetical protein